MDKQPMERQSEVSDQATQRASLQAEQPAAQQPTRAEQPAAQQPTRAEQSAFPQLSPPPKRTTRTGEPKETAQRGYKIIKRAYARTPQRFKNASSFQVRLRTGIIYVALNIVCLLVSDFTTMLILAAMAAMCTGELYYMLRSDSKMPNEVLGILGAIAYPVAVYFTGIMGLIYVTAALVIAVLIWYVYWLQAAVGDMAICFLGAVYTGFQLSGLLLIRMALPDFDGGLLALIVVFTVWMTDSGAYVFGTKLGKHKMAPTISPNKSWEGFVAGLVVSMAFWCLCLLVPGLQINIWECLLFGLICGLVSVLGDLFESRIKRSAGVKDSGDIMPGHGGLFDRCDSLLPTVATAAVLLFAFGCLPMPL